jgi:TetR/AcrR family transcriptional repressor of nem operon
MARPREFDETTVVHAAADAFREKGYAGTSLQDLTAATGLGKGSLYAAFQDKRGLYLKALDTYCAESLVDVGGDLAGPGRAIDRVGDFLLGVARGAAGDGAACLLTSSSAELGGRDPEATERLGGTFAALQLSLESALREAQADGDVGAGADPSALAGMVLAVARGLDTLGCAGADEAALVRTVRTTLAALGTAT